MAVKRVTAVADIKPETWAKLFRHLTDHIGEMQCDAASIAEEEGADFLPALRGLTAWTKEQSEATK